MYEANVSASMYLTIMYSRRSNCSEINEILRIPMVSLGMLKNINPGGPQFTAKAIEIAERLGKSSFKGSSGWLDKWKRKC